MTRPGEIRFDEVPLPALGEEDVLVRIRRIGICGSDLHVYHGKHPYTSYPVVQGHEFCGQVAKLGRAVNTFELGDLVTAPPQIVCGRCALCRKGLYHICENLKVMGFQAPGTAQEYYVFHEAALLPLPPEFTPELGALVEPTAVAMHACSRPGNIKEQRVLVLGAGPIGNLVAQVARWLGAAEVMITDVSDYRLEIARACGISRTVNVRREKLEERVRGGAEEDRPDVTFECVGAEETANQAIRMAKKGSTIVVVGVFSHPPAVDLGLVQDRELRLLGSLMYQRGDYVDAIRCLSEGGIIYQPLLSQTFSFRRFLDAYHYIEANREHVMKVMIDLDDIEA